MRAQVAMEFMVCLLAMVAVLTYLVSMHAEKISEVGALMKQVEVKNAVERVASQCNLVYFNWLRADLGFSFNLSNLQIVNDTFVITESGKEITSRCLSEIGGAGEITVTGVRRWF